MGLKLCLNSFPNARNFLLPSKKVNNFEKLRPLYELIFIGGLDYKLVMEMDFEEMNEAHHALIKLKGKKEV